MPNETDYTYTKNSSQTNLWQFKTVIETGELRYLLRLENYDSLPDFDLSLLASAWAEIYKEFSEAVGGNRADLWLLKVKRLTTMQIQFNLHTVLLRAVENLQHPELVQICNDNGYAITLDDFDKTFEKAYTQLMKKKAHISIFEKEAAADKDEQTPDLDDLIVTLEKFQGYQFNEKEMSVKKFANIYKKYQSDGEARQK